MAEITVMIQHSISNNIKGLLVKERIFIFTSIFDIFIILPKVRYVKPLTNYCISAILS